LLRNTDRTLVRERPDADVSVQRPVSAGLARRKEAEGEGFTPGAAWSLTGTSGHLLRAVGRSGPDAAGSLFIVSCRGVVSRAQAHGRSVELPEAGA
jgi:hypothetical protein